MTANRRAVVLAPDGTTELVHRPPAAAWSGFLTGRLASAAVEPVPLRLDVVMWIDADCTAHDPMRPPNLIASALAVHYRGHRVPVFGAVVFTGPAAAGGQPTGLARRGFRFVDTFIAHARPRGHAPAAAAPPPAAAAQ